MKKLFLIFHGRYPSEKAAGLFAQESAKAFRGEGYEVTVLAPLRRGSERSGEQAVYLPTLDLFGLLPHALAFRLSLFFFSVSTYVYLLFRASRTDVIYTNESLPLFFAEHSFPNTYYEMHDYPHRSHWFFRTLFRHARGVVITNRLKATRFEKDFPEAREKILVEMNAVNLAQFSPTVPRELARESVKFGPNEKYVVYTGHLYGWKGVDTLARSFSYLPSTTYIYFVGGTKEDIARMQALYPHTKNIIFTGHKPHDEIPLWQKAADVLVLPNTARESISVEDTSPMKLFEYMASGTPVVASRLPSVEEIAKDSVVYVTPDDPKALAEGITKVLHGADVAALTKRARELVTEHTWEKRATRIINWLGGLKDQSQSYRHERIIWTASFGVTALFIFLFIVMHGISPSFDSLQSDSYLALAVSLYEKGIFTLSAIAPYVLQVTHSPGYPLFLALTAAPWMNVLPALLIQAVLLAFSAVFTYRLFEGAFSPRVRFIAALLYGIEPYTAFTAAEPLSEALFLFLFLGGLLLLRRGYEYKSLGTFFFAGLAFGASILVRPVAEYIVPLVGIAFLGAMYYRRYERPLALFAVFLVGIVIVLFPWAYRNHHAFGVWTLSTKGPYSLYFFDGAEILKYRDNLSAGAASDALVARAQKTYPDVHNADDLRSPVYSSYLTHETLQIIKESPVLFIKMYVVSLGTFFLSDGYRLLWYEATNGSIVLPNITRAIVGGDVSTIRTYLVEHPIQFAAFVVGLTFWSVILLLAFIGFLSGLVRKDKNLVIAILACALLIAYFALVTGPLAQARYRIVVTPYLFMLAAYGAMVVLRKFHAYRY